MRGAWLEGCRLSYREDIDEPAKEATEVRVRVLRAGICNTDLEMVRGYGGEFRGVLGHEFVGLVSDPSAPPHLANKTVVGDINAACGECPTCVGGLQHHCPTRTVMGIRHRFGAMAEYLCLPVGNLVVVPAHVPPETACFAEPLAAALQIQKQLSFAVSDKVLLLGVGKLGQLIARSLRALCQLTVVATNETVLKLCKGYAAATSSNAQSLADVSFDVVIECTGSPSGLEEALRLVRPRGTVVLKSTHAAPTSASLTPLVVNEVTVIGSRCGPIGEAVAALADGSVRVADLLHSTLPLSRVVDAFQLAGQPSVLKVQLDCQK